MATKIFSGRVDEDKLAFADALAQREYGLSFGQYCGSVLLDHIDSTGHFPALKSGTGHQDKVKAAAFIKSFASRATRPQIGHMSDTEIRDLVASRYE